jgi:hypothetical protein
MWLSLDIHRSRIGSFYSTTVRGKLHLSLYELITIKRERLSGAKLRWVLMHEREQPSKTMEITPVFVGFLND